MLPIKVPPLGESIVEATVSRWQKKEGDAVAAGDTLVELETDIAAVPGTGRGGAVSKPDVLAVPTAGERAGAAPRPSAPAIAPPRGGNGATPGERETREKMSTRRKRIAENLLQSQHATAHLTTFNEVDMSAINALRDKYKEKVEKEHGVKLTFMPFFVRAAVAALKQFPLVNAQIDGDSIVYKH